MESIEKRYERIQQKCRKSALLVRKYRGYLGAILVLLFLLSSVCFSNWTKWTQLAQIANFFVGIGIALTAWQFAFQETKERKEQIFLALEITKDFSLTEERLLSHEGNDSEITVLSGFRDMLLLFNKINMLVDHKFIIFDELYSLAGGSMAKCFIYVIKTFCKFYGTTKGYENNLSDDLLMRTKPILTTLFSKMKKLDASLEFFQEEMNRFVAMAPRQKNLSMLITAVEPVDEGLSMKMDN